MKYLTNMERRGLEKGRQEGRLQALREVILDVLETRFAMVPYELRERILAIAEEAKLKRLHRQAALAESLQVFQSQL